jgi:hypothetical protein
VQDGLNLGGMVKGQFNADRPGEDLAIDKGAKR